MPAPDGETRDDMTGQDTIPATATSDALAAPSAAGGTMVMLPVLFFSILVLRFLVHGLTAGAPKGLILTDNNEALDDPHPPRLAASWSACSHQQTFKPAVPCDDFALDSSGALS
mgnify:CR=1 FL=1